MSEDEHPPHFVSIRPDQLAVDDDATAEVVAALEGYPGEPGGHLGPIHVGLMAVAHDLGHLPCPEDLRSSRDIRAIVHSVADLETLGLATRRGRRVALTQEAEVALTAGLDAWFTARAARAAEALVGAPTAKRGRPVETVRRWLRNLCLLIANRGVRLTRAGDLHAGDLRRLESMCELPSRRFLSATLTVGRATDVVFAMEGRLLVGNEVDLLDLPELAFASTALADAAAGVVDLGHAHVSAIAGLLSGLAEPLAEARGEGDGPTLIGPVSPDPASDFLPAPDEDLLGSSRVRLEDTLSRIRTGLIGLLGQLPLGAALPLAEVADLVHAHVALDLLRRPCRPMPVGGRQSVLLASASHALPAFCGRAQEHLQAWVRELWAPLGAAEVEGEGDDATLTLHDPQPLLLSTTDEVYTASFERELPEPSPAAVQGMVFIQPTGEVLAPPDVSVHGLLHLAQGAELIRLDEVVTFAVTRDSLLRVLHSGMDVPSWAEAVGALSRTGVPQTVLALIDDITRLHGELTLAPAGGVLIARDGVRLDELLSHPALARDVALRPAPTVAILKPGVDMEALLQSINARGFGGVLVDRLETDPGAT